MINQSGAPSSAATMVLPIATKTRIAPNVIRGNVPSSVTAHT